MNASLEHGDYLAAYANGMQFVLLALEGRMRRADDDTDEAPELGEVLMEYHEMAMRLRDRAKSAPDPEGWPQR